MTDSTLQHTLLHTPLHSLHLELGGKMVPFAGYAMPVQYPMGVLKEHLHTRAQAGLFDVSHMGQLRLWGADAAAALETLVPVDLVDLPAQQQRYALFTNDAGGILDDLMVTNAGDHLFVVVNAACKTADTEHLQKHIGTRCRIEPLPTHALLALQGPQAATVLQRLAPGVDYAAWVFMTARTLNLAGASCFVTRSGYTGEDGFEISVAAEAAEAVARLLLAQPEVAPIGLGARDSLRLEAGLCLYGHDINPDTTPIEGGLSWAISKARRAEGARAGGFPGATRILGELANGVNKKRVGLTTTEKVPVREGALIVDEAGHTLGVVTSGGVGPTITSPIAMAYLPTSHTTIGTTVFAQVRGKNVPMQVCKTPFVAQRYYRG